MTPYQHTCVEADKNQQRIALLRCDKDGRIQEKITYKDLKGKIVSTAHFLQKFGLKAGDVLSLAMSNSPELLILSWTAWSLGIITMPLDVKRDTIEQHLYKIKISNAKLLIAKKDIFQEEEKHKLKTMVKTIEIESLPELSSRNILRWKNDVSHEALILFTSGTTSHPKGAKLTLKNLLINADGIKSWFKIKQEDRFMVVLPLHHINSTTFCLAALLAYASIAIVPVYSNSNFWRQVSETQSTFTSIVPSICFDQLSKREEFEKFKGKIKLNRIQIGSAPVIATDVREFIKMYAINLYQGYGQTETALRVTGVPLDINKSLYGKLTETNSIGKPMSWADVQIMGDNGEILGENKDGELAVKGEAVMEGYLLNENAFKNGYFLTGDIGYYQLINGDRYFFLKGRKKEIIIKGGINISPVAVEDGLKKASSDIDQAYVIGFSDRRFGEEVAAVIVWKDADSSKAKVRLKYNLSKGVESIRPYETPQAIASVNSKDLPLTSTGKIQRSLLRKRLSQEAFESIYLIARTQYYQFLKLHRYSPYLKEAFNLYNYCWDSLTVSFGDFKLFAKTQDVIIAVDKDNKVGGLVSFVRTDALEKDLCSITYSKLADPLDKKIKNTKGKKIICVSICSRNYKKQQVSSVAFKATVEEVKDYLAKGEDGIYNFHLSSKGGLRSGAKLICLLPNGRREDRSSLGYNMLLKYPEITQEVSINANSSVVAQLIEVVMFLARALDIKDVYAFSRPAGLAKYLAQTKTG